MNLKKHTLLVILLAGMVAASAWQPVRAEPLSLNHAVDIALESNPRVLQYRERVAQRTFEDREAWGRFLPQVRLEGAYNHLNDPMSIDLNPIRSAMIQIQAGNQVEFANIYRLLQAQAPLTAAERGALYRQYSGALNGMIPPFVETFKQQDYKQLAVIGVQPLFTGGKILAAKKAAKYERRYSDIELNKIANETTNDVVRQYLAVTLVSEAVAVRTDVLAGMKRHQTDAKRLFEEGVIAKAHLLRAEVAVAEAERGLSDEQNRLAIATAALRNTLGFSANTPIELSDSLAMMPLSDSLPVWQNEAVRNQPLLAMVSEKQKTAAQKSVVERADMLPQFAAFGKYETYPQYLSSLEPRWVIGVQASFKLFDGAQAFHRYQSARHLQKEVGYMKDQATLQIQLWVEDSYLRTRNAEAKYHALQASRSLAEETVRQNELRFSNGMATSLEAIDARLQWEKNRIDIIQSKYEYLAGMSELYLAAGKTPDFVAAWQTSAGAAK